MLSNVGSVRLHIQRPTVPPNVVHVVNHPTLPLLALGILTILCDLVAPPDAVAKLLAPCFAWTIIFLGSSTIVLIRTWRQNAGRGPWIERKEIEIAIYFLFSHLCSSAANGFGGYSSPYVHALFVTD